MSPAGQVHATPRAGRPSPASPRRAAQTVCTCGSEGPARLQQGHPHGWGAHGWPVVTPVLPASGPAPHVTSRLTVRATAGGHGYPVSGGLGLGALRADAGSPVPRDSCAPEACLWERDGTARVLTMAPRWRTPHVSALVTSLWHTRMPSTQRSSRYVVKTIRYKSSPGTSRTETLCSTSWGPLPACPRSPDDGPGRRWAPLLPRATGLPSTWLASRG